MDGIVSSHGCHANMENQKRNNNNIGFRFLCQRSSMVKFQGRGTLGRSGLVLVTELEIFGL